MSPSTKLAAGPRPGAPGSWSSPRRGSAQVSELQRSRMLSSAVTVVSEHGYAGMSVARVTGLAGVSRRTFYDLFEDREDCFLAAFDEIIGLLGSRVIPAYEAARSWREQLRATLTVLLEFFDERPGACVLLVVDALKAGPLVLERRARILARLSEVLHEDGLKAAGGRVLPPLTGEGVVGAVLGVIHNRLLSSPTDSMRDLLNPLMGMVVLPYLGPAAAQKELVHPLARGDREPAEVQPASITRGNPLAGLPMRITYRTLVVLTVIAEQPGASNRQVADAAEVPDQGQISKLLARLERLGLIVNNGVAQPSGEPNSWRLTERGVEVQQAIEAQLGQGERRVKAEI